MSLHTSLTQLQASLKDMRVRWEHTLPLWNDAVRRDFEKTHWEPLEAQVLSTLKGMDRLAQAVAAAKQEFDRSR